MGWSRATRLRPPIVSPQGNVNGQRTLEAEAGFKLKTDREHIEYAVADISLSEERVSPGNANEKTFTASQVTKQNTVERGLWIVIEKKVYDVTSFVDVHPGGPEVFKQFAGRDCSWQFWKWHSKKHLEEWAPSLQIGTIRGNPPTNPYREPPRWIRTH